jgi:hypothetical protein
VILAKIFRVAHAQKTYKSNGVGAIKKAGKNNKDLYINNEYEGKSK